MMKWRSTASIRVGSRRFRVRRRLHEPFQQCIGRDLTRADADEQNGGTDQGGNPPLLDRMMTQRGSIEIRIRVVHRMQPPQLCGASPNQAWRVDQTAIDPSAAICSLHALQIRFRFRSKESNG